MNVLSVPEEYRTLTVLYEDRTLYVPSERRVIEIGAAMNIGSKVHTVGDTKRWLVQYGYWLDNSASITQMDIASSSASYTIGNIKILGTDVVFFLSGGAVNERTTLTLTMTDSLGNIKHDTVVFTGVAA